MDVFELERVFLQLEKATVDAEQVGRLQARAMGQLSRFRVAENLVEMDWRHRLKLSTVPRQFNG